MAEIAWVMAGLAAAAGLPVRFWLCADSDAALAGTAAQARDWALARGVRPETGPFDGASPEPDTLLVDGLLGTGLRSAPRPDSAQIIERLNACGAPVLALDLPSGLSADTGAAPGACVEADRTVTFIVPKVGLFTGAGPDVSGRLSLASLGVPERCRSGITGVPLWQRAWPLPPRRPSAFKNRFGHLLVVGGELGSGGAVLLAAEAALRSGCGLVSVATRPQHLPALLSRRPELMVHEVRGFDDCRDLLPRANCVVAGPGMGLGAWGEQLLSAVLDADAPLVLDADALTLLARHGGQAERSQGLVLTPHPGEAARLLGVSSAEIAGDRVGSAIEIAKRYGATVVLKGAGSLVASRSGLHGVCTLGNPGMASAGMGDVLSGIVAALLAQQPVGADVARQAVVAQAVVAHAAAGDLAAARFGQPGMLAADLIDALPSVLSA